MAVRGDLHINLQVRAGSLARTRSDFLALTPAPPSRAAAAAASRAAASPSPPPPPQVWDIGGQSIASKMLGKYVYGSQVVFLCYDVTDRQSFDDVADWLALVRRVYADPIADAGAQVVRSKPPKLYLVGNKVDLQHLRKVTEGTHDAFARAQKLEGGFTMSAQSGENVLRVFYQVAAGIAGVKLSAYELAFTDKCLTASVAADDADEGRTDYADQIEAEDMAAEAAKRKRMEQSCGCVIM